MMMMNDKLTIVALVAVVLVGYAVIIALTHSDARKRKGY